MQYLVKIHWSEEDRAYIAKLPALPGFISHGNTYQETAVMIEEAAKLWLEMSRKYGDPIPEPCEPKNGSDGILEIGNSGFSKLLLDAPDHPAQTDVISKLQEFYLIEMQRFMKPRTGESGRGPAAQEGCVVYHDFIN